MINYILGNPFVIYYNLFDKDYDSEIKQVLMYQVDPRINCINELIVLKGVPKKHKFCIGLNFRTDKSL